jgi:hypothetical protein
VAAALAAVAAQPVLAFHAQNSCVLGIMDVVSPGN